MSRANTATQTDAATLYGQSLKRNMPQANASRAETSITTSPYQLPVYRMLTRPIAQSFSSASLASVHMLNATAHT